jgi:hypothetical protein
MRTSRNPDWVEFEEIEELLDAYAEARLTPRSPVLARIRTNVMTQAASYAAVRAAERRQVEAAPALVEASPRGRFAFPRLTLASFARPAFALGFAFLLALGTGTAVTAAPPGSPFYNTRVALEALFLPTQIDARFASHEQHLDERLAEAEAAAARGDAEALAAALAAYQAEIDQTFADIGDDYGRLAHFQAVLEKHVAKLTALSLRLPTEVARDNAAEHAEEAVAHAIEKSKATATKVKDKKADASNKPSSPPGQNQNQPDQNENQPDAPEPPNRP